MGSRSQGRVLLLVLLAGPLAAIAPAPAPAQQTVQEREDVRYRAKVKLTFARGASLEDPAGLFNASLQGNTRRAIDVHEGDEIDETAFKGLVRAAAALNAAASATARPRGR